ncbi:MAG: hypothetical protein ACE5JU_13580 [Candidatus Binatia bacterium]
MGLWTFLLPALSVIKSEKVQIQFFARGLKIYNPLQTSALGLLVLTGALQLTDLKATYRESFARELGAVLSIKLILSFVMIMLTTYQSMAVAHRFVRRCEEHGVTSLQDLQPVTHRLRGSTLLIFLLTLITALVSLRIQG